MSRSYYNNSSSSSHLWEVVRPYLVGAVPRSLGEGPQLLSLLLGLPPLQVVQPNNRREEGRDI